MTSMLYERGSTHIVAEVLGVSRYEVDPGVAPTLYTLVEALPERFNRALVLRYGLQNGTPQTLRQVGREFGLTPERVRQICNKALRILRRRSSTLQLNPYLDEIGSPPVIARIDAEIEAEKEALKEAKVKHIVPMANPPPHITIAEAASRLGVKPARIWQFIRAGRLPAHQLTPHMWIIDPADLRVLDASDKRRTGS
jgi:hypothetical protein